MNKINYQLRCDKILEEIEKSGRRPRLLLHVCCAPCASYVIEYLEKYFELTLYFYNPNISDYEEYLYRFSELQRFVEERPGVNHRIIGVPHDPEEFFEISHGFESELEGGERCKKCYRLRLERTAKTAAAQGYDYFATTLTVSPYKNPLWLNTIGEELAEDYSVEYLSSDFKKRGGYLRSIELSSIYDLYRQDFCGCSFSRAEAERRREAKSYGNKLSE